MSGMDLCGHCGDYRHQHDEKGCTVCRAGGAPWDKCDGFKEPATEEVKCIACDVPFKEGDEFFPDQDGGDIHATCCEMRAERFTLHDEPLKNGDPLPEPYIWTASPSHTDGAEPDKAKVRHPQSPKGRRPE